MKKTTILYIDDEKYIQDICGKVLVDAGYSVDFAKNGVEGLQKMKESNYDIILLDIMMPYMDGLEMLKQVETQKLQHGKIIMLTNLDNDEIKAEAFKLGAADYLVNSKITPNQLLAKIRNLTI